MITNRLFFVPSMNYLENLDMAWEDPIVKEVRNVRDQIAAEHQYDLRALCKYLQERESRARLSPARRADRS